jgi:uncharacterized protein YjiK
VLSFSSFVLLASLLRALSGSGYTLEVPDKKWVLPPQLHEISGIAQIDSVTFACVQDEQGIVFFYDTRTGRVVRQLPFANPGDYEGITRNGKSLFVLRSDGMLFEISEFNRESPETTLHPTRIPARNNEGLCYDAGKNRLLIGCKGKVDDLAENRDRRFVYAFDLDASALDPQPVFEFNIPELSEFAIRAGVIPPWRDKKNGQIVPSSVRLNTSEIALHPITRELYFLSATDHLLMVTDLTGNIRRMERLDARLFNKPEGITFLENGDMLVTNEGQRGVPTLLLFRYSR